MDLTWQWCERVKENNRLKLKCSFCGNTFSGGISRMKYHLAGTSKGASHYVGGPNKPLPPYVRQQCLDMLHALHQKRIQKEIEEADVGYNEPLEDEEEEEEVYECDDEDDSILRIDLGTSRGRDCRGKWIMYEGGRSGVTGRKRRGTADRARRGMQPPNGRVPTGRSSFGSIKSFFPSYTSLGGQPQIRVAMTSKDMLYQAQKMVRKWFYDACIPFNTANSFQFQVMADVIASIGPGFKMQSYHQLRGKILQDTVKEVSEHCNQLKLSWKETGCSIMSDGWTDTRSRTLVNFLVYCPKGTMFLKSLDLSDVPKTAEILFNVFDNVIQEVGPTNIVQFITDNAANYRATGDLLFQKYGTFFWSPCATHCVNLMLQDLNEMHDMKSAIEQCQEVTKFYL
ncbi:uncharacterized protein LOC126410179 [Nymphaea colorata]|uniref:uncharacterized protein LOC126410179 n=1 Tax=Nymphaea colorata TaxID=210225 RepID=UPI00214E9A7C|nr:uncharacterized protein LOC126410179 [Nymphaea colorata]